MVMRGSPARRVVGNPLGGVLAHLDQRARISGRRRTGGGEQPDPSPLDVTPAAPPQGPSGAVLVTGGDGRAQWVFPAPYAAAPAVTAVAVDDAPGDDERTVWAVLEEVTTWCATLRVWRTRPRRGQGVAEPAGPGVRVHAIAVEAGRPG